MKIYTQDRKRIIEMPKEVWITECGSVSFIVGTSYSNPTLGTYEVSKAEGILKEMFDYYRNGKNSYIMPEQ